MLPYTRAAAFSLLEKSPATRPPTDAPFTIAGSAGNETRSNHLGFTAISWILPRELTFSRVVIEPRLQWLLEAYGGVLRRLKAVLRTGPGPSWSFQSHGR